MTEKVTSDVDVWGREAMAAGFDRKRLSPDT